MLYYNYDGSTGQYLNSAEATESPLEPGVFLIPANATELAPPTPPTGSVAVWQNGAWTTVVDNIGDVYYQTDGTQVTITTLGQVPDPSWTTSPPAPTTAQLMASLRSTRNGLLDTSDWTQLPDTTLSTEQVAAWKVYRTTLRNLPETPNLDPANPPWPTPPSST